MASDRVRELVERGLIPSVVQAVATVEGRQTLQPVPVRRYAEQGVPDTPLVQLPRRQRGRGTEARGRRGGKDRGKGKSPGRRSGS